MKNIMKIVLSKITFIIIALLLQLFFIVGVVYYFNKHFTYIYAFSSLLGLILVLYLISKNEIPEIKLAWIVCIIILPVTGVTLYMLFGHPVINKKYRNIISLLQRKLEKTLIQDKEVLNNLKNSNSLISTQSNYIYKASHCPVYQNTDTEYLRLGEIKFEKVKEELKKAKRYIFVQYFIIQEGKMWNEILDILIEKSKQGVDVRVMYDDVGCVPTLPYKYDKKLNSLGIKCKVINPLRPSLNIVLQNRDHRKIIVIDGEIGFTGGVNLADEYINEYPKHGHWKDCAVMIKGDAVFSFVVMFLQTWYVHSKEKEEFEKYRPEYNYIEKNAEKGFVQPYFDSPLDTEYTSQNVYKNILNQSKEYVYINSPYFIIDNDLLNSFIGAAKRGVDVRVVTPHIADKWYVHAVTRSYYKRLIEVGVKIYEYTPGFIHSKTFVSDDCVATIGTVNLDYRSLYHHFECGVWLYESKAVNQLKEDYLNTLESCQQIKYKDCNEKWYKAMFIWIIKIITPLF